MIEKIPLSMCITVEEFLPKWTVFMERYLTEGKRLELQQSIGLDINESDRCLVAEAHFFEKVYYNCSYCAGVACGVMTIGGHSYTQALKTLKRFYRFKKGLYDHFIESHREKLSRNYLTEGKGK